MKSGHRALHFGEELEEDPLLLFWELELDELEGGGFGTIVLDELPEVPDELPEVPDEEPGGVLAFH